MTLTILDFENFDNFDDFDNFGQKIFRGSQKVATRLGLSSQSCLACPSTFSIFIMKQRLYLLFRLRHANSFEKSNLVYVLKRFKNRNSCSKKVRYNYYA